jgi:hypothetical protein
MVLHDIELGATSNLVNFCNGSCYEYGMVLHVMQTDAQYRGHLELDVIHLLDLLCNCPQNLVLHI